MPSSPSNQSASRAMRTAVGDSSPSPSKKQLPQPGRDVVAQLPQNNMNSPESGWIPIALSPSVKADAHSQPTIYLETDTNDSFPLLLSDSVGPSLETRVTAPGTKQSKMADPPKSPTPSPPYLLPATRYEPPKSPATSSPYFLPATRYEPPRACNEGPPTLGCRYPPIRGLPSPVLRPSTRHAPNVSRHKPDAQADTNPQAQKYSSPAALARTSPTRHAIARAQVPNPTSKPTASAPSTVVLKALPFRVIDFGTTATSTKIRTQYARRERHGRADSESASSSLSSGERHTSKPTTPVTAVQMRTDEEIAAVMQKTEERLEEHTMGGPEHGIAVRDFALEALEKQKKAEKDDGDKAEKDAEEEKKKKEVMHGAGEKRKFSGDGEDNRRDGGKIRSLSKEESEAFIKRHVAGGQEES